MKNKPPTHFGSSNINQVENKKFMDQAIADTNTEKGDQITLHIIKINLFLMLLDAISIG